MRRLLFFCLIYGLLVDTIHSSDMPLPTVSYSTSQVQIRQSRTSMAANQSDRVCSPHDSRFCWNREAYEQVKHSLPKVEKFQQVNHGWDGGPYIVPDYEEISFHQGSTNTVVDQSIRIEDPAFDMSFSLNTRNSNAEEIVKGVTHIGIGFVSQVQRLQEKREVALKIRMAYQNHYEQAAAQNRSYISQLRESSRRIDRETSRLYQKAMLNVGESLGRVNSMLMSAADRSAFGESVELANDPLRDVSYEVDEEGYKNYEKAAQQAFTKGRYRYLAEILEPLYQAEVEGVDIDPNYEFANSEGVMSVGGPLDQTNFQTNPSSSEGQIVRRIANRYQALYMESGGLATYNEAAQARFVAGILALQSADSGFGANYLRSSKLLKAASVIADSLDGFSEGFGDALGDLAESVPALWNLTKNGAQALWDDPATAWQSVVEFAYQLDDVTEAVMTAVSADLDTLSEGNAYERSKIIGYYSLDVVTAVASGGAVAVAKGVSKAGSLAKFLETAGDIAKISKNASLEVVRKAAVPTQKLIENVRTLGLRNSTDVSRINTISRQVMMTDKSVYNAIDKMAESARAVRPRQGDRFVRDLPDLEGSLEEAFEGQIFKGTYEPGEILFQAQREMQTRTGSWFTPIKPLNADHADEMLNIRKWNNDGQQIKAYVVKERVSGYAGKVEGAEGHQFFVPRGVPLDEIFKEVIFE